jgi:hypothetical protein
MPYKSDAQRRYFNANRKELEAQGVDVDEWNTESKGKKLPKRAKKKRKKEKSAGFFRSAPQPEPKLSAAAIRAALTKQRPGYGEALIEYLSQQPMDAMDLEDAITFQRDPRDMWPDAPGHDEAVYDTDTDFVVDENGEVVWDDAGPVSENLYEKNLLAKQAAAVPSLGTDLSFTEGMDIEQIRQELLQRVQLIAQLRAHRDALLDDKARASIKLASSRVHGTGLFTNVNIKKGTKFARAMVRMRGKDAQSRYELTKAARYTNHSQNPSAQMVKVGNEIYLVALKAIPADTEVLVDYRKTASVLGPGSYITFKGEKRTTWNQLEKQAGGVAFTEKQAGGGPLVGGGGLTAPPVDPFATPLPAELAAEQLKALEALPDGFRLGKMYNDKVDTLRGGAPLVDRDAVFRRRMKEKAGIKLNLPPIMHDVPSAVKAHQRETWKGWEQDRRDFERDSYAQRWDEYEKAPVDWQRHIGRPTPTPSSGWTPPPEEFLDGKPGASADPIARAIKLAASGIPQAPEIGGAAAASPADQYLQQQRADIAKDKPPMYGSAAEGAAAMPKRDRNLGGHWITPTMPGYSVADGGKTDTELEEMTPLSFAGLGLHPPEAQARRMAENGGMIHGIVPATGVGGSFGSGVKGIAQLGRTANTATQELQGMMSSSPGQLTLPAHLQPGRAGAAAAKATSAPLTKPNPRLESRARPAAGKFNKPGASADPIDRAIKQAMFLPFHTNKYRDELLGRIEKRQLAAMDKRKKQLIAEGASPEGFAELDYSESPKWQRESAARRKQKAEAEEKEEKKADMLKNLGEGVATGVEGLTGTVRKALELLVEDVEEREKEEEKLEKAIKRNARERKARKIAKTDAWKYAYYNPAVAYGMSTEEIQASTAQLGRMLNSRLKYKPKKKKKRRKKDYAAETELQKLKTREKMMLQDARHQNLMAELRLRQEMANARIKAGSSGPITKALEFAGVDSKVLEFAGIKKKDKDEEKRKEEELAEAQAQNMTPAAKYGALLAKKSFEIMKTANSAAPQASYLQQQANPTQQRSSAHEQMNAQAGGAGPQQPALPPDQQQVLAQRPQARPSSRQRPLNPTAANLGIGPLTGDQFAPGAQSGLGMAVTARAINGQGDLIDRALQSIKQAGGGFEEQMRPGPLPRGNITPKEEQEAKWVEEDLRQRKEDYDADSRAFAKDLPQDNSGMDLPGNEDTGHLRDPRRIAAKRMLETMHEPNPHHLMQPPPTGFVEIGDMPTPWEEWYRRTGSRSSAGQGAGQHFQGVTPPYSPYSTRMDLERSVDIVTGEDWKTRDTPELTMVLPGTGGGRTWRRDRAPWRKERALSSTEAAYQKIFPDLTEVEIDDGGGYLRSDNWLDEDPKNWGGKDPFKRREEFPPPPKPLTPQQQQIAKLKQSPLGNIARRIGVGLGGGNPFGRGAGGEQLLEMPTVDPLEPGEMPKEGRANGQGDPIDRALRSIEKRALESLDMGALAGGVIGGTAGGVLGFGGAAGATVGGLYGLFSDPGEDEEGSKVHHMDRRLWRALKGALGGGALGVAGAGAGIAGGVLGAVEGGKLGYRVGEEKQAKDPKLTPDQAEWFRTRGGIPTNEANYFDAGTELPVPISRSELPWFSPIYKPQDDIYKSMDTLSGQVQKYYKNQPGGYSKAVSDALAAQESRNQSIWGGSAVDKRLAAYPRFTEKDLNRPISTYWMPEVAYPGERPWGGNTAGGVTQALGRPTRIYNTTKRNSGDPLRETYLSQDLAREYRASGHVGKDFQISRDGRVLGNYDPRKNPATQPTRTYNGKTIYTPGSIPFTPGREVPFQQKTREHELTHAATETDASVVAALPGAILSGGGRWGGGRGVFNRGVLEPAKFPERNPTGTPDHVDKKIWNYMTTPVEMDPRIAEIKRSYTAAHPGRAVNTDAEARRAWKWWGKHLDKNPNSGSWRDGGVWKRLNRDPVQRESILKRMLELVKTDPQQGMSQREVVAHALNGQGDLIDRALQSIKMAEPVEEPADFNLGDHLVGVDTTSLPPDQPGSTMPSVIDRKSVALADVLPKGYRAGAQQHAKAWRASNPRVEEGYSQDISDKAIDRKVDVVTLRPKGFKKNYGRGSLPVDQVGAYYNPNLHGGQIVLPENPVRDHLGHELTHGTQEHNHSIFGEWPPSYQDDIETALAEASSPTFRENPARFAKYFGSQRESEAFLATIKRDYYEATGKHVTNAQEAQEALEWNREQPYTSRVELRNEGLSRDQILGPDGKMGTDDDRTNPDGSPILNANTQPLSPKAKAAKENWMKHWAEKMPGLVDTGSPNRFGKTASQGDLIDRALQSIKQADRGTPEPPMTLKPSTGTPVLPLPANLLGHGIAGGIGGAGIGALINAVKGRSIGRGAVTGGITGAGALSGMGLGANLSRHPVAEFTGGWAGLGGGGYGGYQLAQYLQGAEEEEEEEEEKKAGGGLYPQIPEAIGGGGVGPAAPSAPKALANGGRLANGMLPGGTIDESGVYWQPKPKPKPMPARSFNEMIERRLKDLQKRIDAEKIRKAIREGKVASANHAGEEELNKLSEDAGYSPKAQAGGKVKGFPKTLPGVPQVPAWGSDKAIRTPKDTSLGPVKAQSQAKKQFPTKDPFKALERDGFKDGDIEMPSYGDVIDNVDSVRQTYDETKFSSASVVDPIARLLAITKTSTSNTPKRRRKGAPRSVTIKKPARTNPDTGEVTPGSSHIKHIARAGKKLS